MPRTFRSDRFNYFPFPDTVNTIMEAALILKDDWDYSSSLYHEKQKLASTITDRVVAEFRRQNQSLLRRLDATAWRIERCDGIWMIGFKGPQ